MSRYLLGLLFVAFVYVGQSYAQVVDAATPYSSYVGIEAGLNQSQLHGVDHFFITYFYPFADDPSSNIISSLPFSNPGTGTGFHIAFSIDLLFQDKWGMCAKIFFRQNQTSQTELHSNPGTGPGTGVSGASYEDHYQLTLQYGGLRLAATYQLVPEYLYVIGGVEFALLASDRIEGYERIKNPSNGESFLSQPSKSLTEQTAILIASQPTNNAINSSHIGTVIGLGSNIRIGSSHWFISPEATIVVPMLNLFASDFHDKYNTGYPTNNINYPRFPATNTPSLWQGSISIGIKYGFGGKRRDSDR